LWSPQVSMWICGFLYLFSECGNTEMPWRELNATNAIFSHYGMRVGAYIPEHSNTSWKNSKVLIYSSMNLLKSFLCSWLYFPILLPNFPSSNKLLITKFFSESPHLSEPKTKLMVNIVISYFFLSMLLLEIWAAVISTEHRNGRIRIRKDNTDVLAFWYHTRPLTKGNYCSDTSSWITFPSFFLPLFLPSCLLHSLLFHYFNFCFCFHPFSSNIIGLI
jgi:hypothetical protein